MVFSLNGMYRKTSHLIISHFKSLITNGSDQRMVGLIQNQSLTDSGFLLVAGLGLEPRAFGSYRTMQCYEQNPASLPLVWWIQIYLF